MVQFNIGDTSKGTPNVQPQSFLLKYPCKNGSDCSFYETTLPEGKYLLEAWGAQGGNTDYGGVGGKGGYSRGVLTLFKETKLFIHVGGQPENQTSGGSFNYIKIYGGYNGGGSSAQNSNCNGGGGGTDIRINENTLYHRVLVAGGGGGESYYCSGNKPGSFPAGAGGGLEGQASTYGPSTNGGKQDQGGTGGYVGDYGTQGSFGLGGIHGSGSAGGGGGWYGGSGSNNTGYCTGGAGGSGYVFNKTSFQPTGFKLTSEYYLSEGDTIQGTKEFLSPEGNKEIGHTGHGAVKITSCLGSNIKHICTKLEKCRRQEKLHLF